MERMHRAAATTKENMKRDFDPREIADQIDRHTAEVLAYVHALQSAPGPSEETLRKRICV